MDDLDPREPFTRADARGAGIRLTELSGPAYHRLFFDMYVAAVTPVTPQLEGRAALKVSPAGSHVSHFTAAKIWGGIVPDQSHIHVAVPRPGHRSERRSVKGHLSRPGTQVLVRDGLRISSPAQTFLDLAAVLGLVDLVVLGDSLVKAERTTPEDLAAAAEAWRGHGARHARRAARLVRTGVDSAMETRLRMLIVLAGLPEPQVNYIVRGDYGEWIRRFDLCYLGVKVLVEYDGRQHAEDDDQWLGDIRRREYLDREGGGSSS